MLKLKPGDRVICNPKSKNYPNNDFQDLCDYTKKNPLVIDSIKTETQVVGNVSQKVLSFSFNNGALNRYYYVKDWEKYDYFIKLNEEETMFSTVKNEIVEVYEKNKSFIFMTLSLFLVDHFFFQGKFRDKFTELFEKTMNRLFKAIEGKNE